MSSLKQLEVQERADRFKLLALITVNILFVLVDILELTH